MFMPTITNERYEQLIAAETERNIIVSAVKSAKYSTDIGDVAKVVLAPYLAEPKPEGETPHAE